MLCIKCCFKGSRKKQKKFELSKLAVTERSDLRNHDTETETKPVKRRTVRIATFNTALFSMAPVLPTKEASEAPNSFKWDFKDNSRMPRSILKHRNVWDSGDNGALRISTKSGSSWEGSTSQTRLKVTINLPENEISLSRRHSMNSLVEDPDRKDDSEQSFGTSQYPLWNKSIYEVLKEVDADLLALQEVKAEEEHQMKPLSALADALGMQYIFAESWAPQYGNAILSKWPIKKFSTQKIVDESDFRNVLKAVVDVPAFGELHFNCTQLDHLDEDWRIKQLLAITDNDAATPQVLAGTLNALDRTDYSQDRWHDIIKFNEARGKPTPKGDAIKLLCERGYTDAKHSAGECESVVILAKGQEVQGTCNYGTRIDYIFTSPNAPYIFVPGSYEVISSKGTSYHHVVKSEIELPETEKSLPEKRTMKTTQHSFKGIWKLDSTRERW